MTLSKKTNVFTAIVFITMAILSMLYINSLIELNRQFRNYENAGEIIKGVFELSLLTSEHFTRSTERTKVQWNNKHASVTNLLLILYKKIDDDNNVYLDRVRKGLAKIRRLIFKVRATEMTSNINSNNSRYLSSLGSQIRITSQTVVSDVNRLGIQTQDKLNVIQNKNNLILAIAMTILTVIFIGILIAIRKLFLNPIAKLKHYSSELIDGNYKKEVVLYGNNELSELSASFNILAKTISEKIKLLESTNIELESYAYSISHDLRSPLRTIDGFSLILEEDFAHQLDDEAKGYLQRIRSGTEKMGTLIRELLKMSRISKEELNKINVDLSEIANNEIGKLKSLYPDKPIEFSCQDKMSAYVDKPLIESVIENLVTNAVKYSMNEERIKIEMGTFEENDKTIYYVKDNGVGFNMEYIDKLFKPFQRLHKVTEFEGIGIGLATAQRILERHSGSMWADSSVNQGATFYFTL